MPGQTFSYSSGGLSIDPVRPEDFPVFRELLGEMVEALDQLDLYTVTDDELKRAIFQDAPQMEAIIARYKGEPAGLATFTEGFHLVRGWNVMSFEYLFVRPRFRPYSIAVAMLIYLLLLARSRGYRRIEGFVEDRNEPTAALYRALNAQPAEQASYRLDLGAVDWSQFERFIGPS
jgi:GNAT superfamily N-acetyltransferase